MIDDVKRRAPYYWSDWTDAWDYRVVPATVYMYFAKYVQINTDISQFDPIVKPLIAFTAFQESFTYQSP